MTKRFLGFMPKDAPDEAIAAYIKEAGKIATDLTGGDEALILALSPVWEKHFGTLSNGSSMVEANE